MEMYPNTPFCCSPGNHVGNQLRPGLFTSKKCPGLRWKEVQFSSHVTFSKLKRKGISNHSFIVCSVDTTQGNFLPLVKMCGITSAKDAALAAEAGANFIGMIMSPNFKRSVSLNVAKEISKVSREYGAEPVGVFVDDDADTILIASDEAGLGYVQLHGNGSRDTFKMTVQDNRVIYVLHVNEDGSLQNSITDEECSQADWILVDSAKGGSGKGFNWSKFERPRMRSKGGWLLAGGITPENVYEALWTLRPHGVDVSSGICGPDGIQKDPTRIRSFMDAITSVNVTPHFLSNFRKDTPRSSW